MGREWYYWGASKSSKRGGGRADKDAVATAAPSGCMCAVFQLFDFHQFQLAGSLNHRPSYSDGGDPFHVIEDHPVPKGAEAPRNSLELQEPPPGMKDEDGNLNIPMAIQIKTKSKPHGTASSDCSSEISSSPGTKTPNLVARLMGLDLLPDQPIPNPHSYLRHRFVRNRQSLPTKPIPHRHSLDGGTRSLPETPRISSARRSDVEHRLSLQINKENMNPSEEIVLNRLRKNLKPEDGESKSPGRYARQIVKQVKESVVGRKAGSDITNTVRNKEELVSRFKCKRLLSTNGGGDYDSATTCSPRLKFLENKNKQEEPAKHSDKACSTKAKLSPVQVQPPPRPIKKSKKMVVIGEEKFVLVPQPARVKKPPPTSAAVIRNKQEESFVRTTLAATTRANSSDKKCKKTPLSNDLLNNIIPATKIPPKSVPHAQESKRSGTQLSSCASQTVSYIKQHKLDARGVNNDNKNGDMMSTGGGAASTSGGGDGAGAEYEYYITRILKRTGIDNYTPVSFTRWFSPSHPLDPSTFYYLELFTTFAAGELRHKSNRKLLFHLVDEILVELLKPYINLKPWAKSSISSQDFSMKGSDLVRMLCSKIRSYPSADCRVLEDIDALIDGDLPEARAESGTAYGEAAEGMVAEIEKEILESLISETAVVIRFD